MREPPVAVQQPQLDRRNADKLARSPGSYFVARARDLRLAPNYYRQRLAEGSYGGTANRHYHNLCEAIFASIMSAFELTWKTTYAAIVDAAPDYDTTLVEHKSTRDVVTTESLVAHREAESVGSVIAASLGTWQKADSVNQRYEALLEMRPISNGDASVVDQLWQVRHIVAHNAGIVGPLDEYRLGSTGLTNKPLQLDVDYLADAEAELVRILTAGIGRIRDALFQHYFDTGATFEWSRDQNSFSTLYLICHLAARSAELPIIEEAHYEQARLQYGPQAGP